MPNYIIKLSLFLILLTPLELFTLKAQSLAEHEVDEYSFGKGKQKPDLKLSSYIPSEDPDLWHSGSITLVDGRTLQDVQLRYNFDVDLVEIRDNNGFLKLQSGKIAGFSVGGGSSFRNGFELIESSAASKKEDNTITYGFGITGKSSIKQVVPMMQKVYGISYVRVFSFDLKQKKDKIKGRLIFGAKGESEAFQLRRTLQRESFITEVKILESFEIDDSQEDSNDQVEYDKESFFEILVPGQFSLLKHMTMQKKTIVDALTLQQSLTEMPVPTYFIATANNEIFAIKKSKKAIELQLETSEASAGQLNRIKAYKGSVKKEKGLIDLFNVINQ